MSPHPSFKLRDEALLVKGGWINGKTRPSSSGQTYPIIDPATGKAWFEQQNLDSKDVDAAIQAATDAFPAWSKTPARQRGQLILKADQLLAEAKDDVAQIMVCENGKTLSEAKGEITGCSGYSFIMAGEGERMTGETIRGTDASNASMRYLTVREPIGPVALLTPWNFPLIIPWRKSVAALAAGCTIVLKPAPETALTALALGVLFTRAGLPDGVFNIIPTSYKDTPTIGKQLCEDPRLRGLHFTGSTAVGKLLVQQSAGTLKHMGLELGGNGAFLVFEDADLEKATTALMGNKYRNAGQVCVCANRVYVQRSIMDSFVSLLKAKVQALVTGHGLDEGVTIGAITTERGRDRAEDFISDAVSKGAKLVTGGTRVGSGFQLQPALLVGASLDADAHTTEMFSPIASLYAFDTEEELMLQVVRLSNDTPFGLTNYVFTENLSRGFRLFESLQSGQVAINTGNATAPEAPFGGIKESGWGKEGGFKYAVEDFCHVRVCAIAL